MKPQSGRGLLSVVPIVAFVSFALLAVHMSGQQQTTNRRSHFLSSCEATARGAELDGKLVVIAGRYYLNPSSSADAPNLLGDVAADECRIAGAQAAVIVDWSKTGDSSVSKEFRKYESDLIPNPCPPKAICIPDKIARFLYVDVVAKGRFEVIPATERGSTYCCRFAVEDVISLDPGPEQKPMKPNEKR